MARPVIGSICPFFIVSNIEKITTFYQDKLGFETCYKEPGENPFFAIVRRDGAWLLLKAREAEPLPNPKRDPAMRWDAFPEDA
jgi:catechol 2,3-dioxygenase-like lactoylglutathione lyase family enzyme